MHANVDPVFGWKSGIKYGGNCIDKTSATQGDQWIENSESRRAPETWGHKESYVSCING